MDKSVHNWYKLARWQKMRKVQLSRHPMCQCPHCKEKGDVATVVDHKVPHKGNRKLFWDKTNLQSMSKSHHDSMKQSAEKGGFGFNKGCNEDGTPLNSEHSWYA